MAALVGLSACGAPAYDNSLSPAENELRAANARFNQTVGEGAVVGAVAGGLLGALVSRNRAQGALIGAGAGAALGAGAGYLVARNNAQRSRSEADYNNAIQQAQADADAYRRSAAASRSIAQEALRRVAELDAQYRARSITAAQYRSAVQPYQGDLEIIRKQISDAAAASSAMRQDARSAGSQNSARLSQTANDVDTARAELSRNQDQIARALATVPAA